MDGFVKDAVGDTTPWVASAACGSSVSGKSYVAKGLAADSWLCHSELRVCADLEGG
jgi:hypothetical protein